MFSLNHFNPCPKRFCSDFCSEGLREEIEQILILCTYSLSWKPQVCSSLILPLVYFPWVQYQAHYQAQYQVHCKGYYQVRHQGQNYVQCKVYYEVHYQGQYQMHCKVVRCTIRYTIRYIRGCNTR